MANPLSDVMAEWVSDLQTSLPHRDAIADFFDALNDVYTTWIKVGSATASTRLRNLIAKKNLFKQFTDRARHVYFRARQSTQHLSKEDLYHIPFHKRYLVGNQRYSIAGQPCLYLGSSVPDVLLELRRPLEGTEDIAFSCFLLKPEASLKLFNFTNEFPGWFSTLNALGHAGGKIKFDSEDLHPKAADCRDSFFRFILVSCCSFQRRLRSEDRSFSEEYVLPQLITELARKRSYDGLTFLSTRVRREACYSDAPYYQNAYKLNCVLFTRYRASAEFDATMLKKFIVSEPRTISNTQDVSVDDVAELSKEIIQLNNTKPYFRSLQQMADLSGIGTKVDFESILVKSDKGFTPYFDHPLGRFHLYLVYNFLHQIRNMMAAL